MVLKIQFQVMPLIRVKLFANFREFTGTKDIELEGGTVREIIKKFCKKFPGIEEMIFEGEDIQPYVNIFLNGRNVFESGGLEMRLHQEDEIAIFPPVSGG